MLSIGTIFIVGAGYRILGHGSAFGLANYCKGIRREHAELLAKSDCGEQLNSSERQLIHYIRLSKHLDKASYVLLVAGIVLCLGGIIV